MIFWLSSSVACLIAIAISNITIKQRILNNGNIPKGKRPTKTGVIVGCVISLTPYVNLGLMALNAIGTVIALKNDQILKESKKDITHSPEHVIMSYERKVDEKAMVDAMILDGADKDIIKEEIKQFNNKEKGFAEKEKIGSFTFYHDNPYFNEKDYNLANAQMLANCMLFEIESNIDLSKKERRELLSSLRKVYLDEIKGKKHPSMKPIEKAYQIANKER